ncbi:MAG: helix-turn-helix domain-containing protein [Pseudomonadota bacterium]
MVEEVAFQRIDVRLAQKLLSMASADSSIATTHHDLAVELGTAREVISRQLREFQRRGWIQQARGSIKLIDTSSMSALCSS